MITLSNLRVLQESNLETSDDYLEGIDITSLQYFDEAAFGTELYGKEILTEAAGKSILDRIKGIFAAIAKFFKMLAAKIKTFIKGFFKKAKSEAAEASKKAEEAAKTQDVPDNVVEEISKAEEEVQQAKEEVKEAKEPEQKEQKQEEVKKAEEKVSKLKEKYHLANSWSAYRYKKYRQKKDTDVKEFVYEIVPGLFSFATFRLSALKVHALAMHQSKPSSELEDLTDIYNGQVSFVEYFDLEDLADEKTAKYMRHRFNRFIEVIDLSAKPNFDDRQQLAAAFMKIDDNGNKQFDLVKPREISGNVKELTKAIDKSLENGEDHLEHIMKYHDMAADNANKQMRKIEKFNQRNADFDTSKIDPELMKLFNEAMSTLSSFYGKLNSTIAQITSMHVASIKKAIEYDINLLKKLGKSDEE